MSEIVSELPDDPQDAERPSSSQQTLKIIWLALLFGLAIYALLPPLLRLPTIDPDPLLQAVLFVALAGAAVATVVAIVLVRRIGLSAPLARSEFDLKSPAGHARAALVSIIAWALSESVALYGVVLYLIFHQPLHLYPFLLVSLGLLLLQAPGNAEDSGGGKSSDLARPDVKIG